MKSAQMAWKYIALRIVYTIIYLGGGGTQAAGYVRALVWGLGFSGNVSHFQLALRA
jgi:uncharacterized MAPEG superfamily protein